MGGPLLASRLHRLLQRSLVPIGTRSRQSPIGYRGPESATRAGSTNSRPGRKNSNLRLECAIVRQKKINKSAEARVYIIQSYTLGHVGVLFARLSVNQHQTRRGENREQRRKALIILGQIAASLLQCFSASFCSHLNTQILLL